MIITNNEEALRVRCEDVAIDDIGALIEQLDRELEYSEKMGRAGIGLAGPQVAISKKIAIVRLGEQKLNLVNCKIKNKYDQMMFKGEGCLSFPGRIENTMRYQEVHVVDNLVYPHNFIATGLMAIVIQHELDHLSGILLPDVAIKELKKNKIGPNDPCICGSKIKYKRCCRRK